MLILLMDLGLLGGSVVEVHDTPMCNLCVISLCTLQCVISKADPL